MEAQINLPRDAEGREIPLDTALLYGKVSGEEYEVVCFNFRPSMRQWRVELKRRDGLCIYATESFTLSPPDTWEKLLDDLDNAAKGGDNAECLYSRREGVEPGSQCYGCKLYNQDYGSSECESLAYGDIAARIRKLSGEDE